MKIAIIGGGLTGLSAAYELGKLSHQVSVFEKEPVLGGLALGFQEKEWEWSLEKFYHHLFTNDDAIIGLMGELGMSAKLIIRRPVTATLWRERVYQMDTPLHLLKYPGLSFSQRIRTGAFLAAIKTLPFVGSLETTTTQELLRTYGGEGAWKALWQPLLEGKFNGYAPSVAASWFWARMKKRTPQLAYVNGGFQTLITALQTSVQKYGGVIRTNTDVSSLRVDKTGKPVIRSIPFDAVLFTVPTPVIARIVPTLNAFLKPALSIAHLHAQVLVLETAQPVLNNTYWLNITDRSYPFLVAVAHTNFVESSHYNNHHITYLGNYLPEGHPYLLLTKEELLKKFLPYIKRINPSFSPQLSIINYQLFTGFYAQPVHQLNYSRKAPKFTTPIKNLYIANMDSIFPWDRGTNYAVELGLKAARLIHENK